MYQIIFTKKAENQLLAVEGMVQERIVSVIRRIQIQPHHFCKKLSNSEVYRLRVGDYRVILDISDKNKEIRILKIGHRKNIYD